MSSVSIKILIGEKRWCHECYLPFILEAIEVFLGHHDNEVVEELTIEEVWVSISAWVRRYEPTGYANVVIKTNRPTWVEQQLSSFTISFE